MKPILLTLILILLGCTPISLACTGGTLAGTLTPTASYATTNVTTGQYFAVNVTCGYTYNFTFCSNGGTAGFDTQLTLNQTNNTTQLAYNDDNCGLQSAVSWTANFTGTIHVLTSLYNCNNSGGNSGTLAYNVVAPTISYTASCTSATATYPTSCPGTFAFNPVPTDGAVIDNSTGFVSNAVEGASYTIEYIQGGNTTVLPITMQTAPCYLLNGDANYFTVAGENCIELTAAQNDQTGCAWSESQIDFNSDFTLSLDYYFGTDPNGADGTSFTFQPNPGACGASGAQLGAGGIPNSLIVEFDTYDNDGAANNDLACDHIAVEIDGDLPDDPSSFPANQAPYCGPICANAGGASLEDGTTHEIEITWNATTQQLEIYFDGNLRLACSGDFVNTVFGGQNFVYWGATAATGGLNNQQYFCPETVILLPSELSTFTSVCDKDKTYAKWTSVSEKDLHYYNLEYSYDGYLYYSFAQLQGQGNSVDINQYSVDITTIADRTPYLRLKMVDFNGDIKNTDIIQSIDCSKKDSKVITQSIVNNTLQMHSTDGKEFSYELIDIQGKTIQKGQSTNGSVTSIENYSKGVYFVTIHSLNSSETQQEKLIAY